jgi:hypothetical protein
MTMVVRTRQPKARMMRALKVGVRRSASYVTVLTPATNACWEQLYSEKMASQIKVLSKSYRPVSIRRRKLLDRQQSRKSPRLTDVSLTLISLV